MSISSELLTLNTTKQNIKSMINANGVTVTDEPFAQYGNKVRLIPSGGGIYESDIVQFIEGTMKNAEIPSGTTTIADRVFYDGDTVDNYLESVTIPNSVTSIGQYAFMGDEYLGPSIILPSGITSIGQGAFLNCVNLVSITCLSTVPPTLGVTAMSTTNQNTVIYVPAESVLAYQTADVWQGYASMIQAIPN